MSRLPTVGSDYGTWGTVLNDYLSETATISTLSASSSVAATTLTLAVVPSSLRTGCVVAVDAYTTQCELRAVTNVSGNTITVGALMFSHADGDTIEVVTNSNVPTAYFGLTGDGTDEWQPLQRLFRETALLELVIVGDRQFYQFQQPIIADTGSKINKLQLTTRTGFAPVLSNGAAIMTSNGQFFFTADSGTNVFTSTGADYTTPVAHNLGVDTLIVFNAPYGETLPGGVTSGRVYWVKSVPTGSTFTVSETQGGATLDVTSSGTGWSANDPHTGLARVYWETLYLRLAIADLNGIWANLQQPGWTRNLRVEMSADATNPGDAIGFICDGQNSYHDNMEINTDTNCVGLQLTGTGHIVRGFNDNGSEGTADVGVLFEEAQNCAVYDPWTENVTTGIRIDGTSRGVVIGGTWIASMPTSSAPMLEVVSTSTSYSVGMMRIQTGGFIFVDDTVRGFTLRSSGGAGTDDVVGDAGLAFNGLRQPYGAVAPVLAERSHTLTSTSRTIYHGEQTVEVNATGAPKTMTLPDSSAWPGWQVTVFNASTSGVNAVTVDCTGGETIDGLSSVSLAIGEAMTFTAVSGAYRRTSEFVP